MSVFTPEQNVVLAEANLLEAKAALLRHSIGVKATTVEFKNPDLKAAMAKVQEDVQEEEEPKPAPKKKGRPSKAKKEPEPELDEMEEDLGVEDEDLTEEPAEEEEEEEAPKEIGAEEFLKLAVGLCKKAEGGILVNRPKAVALATKLFKVKTVHDIPADKRAAFLKELPSVL